MSRHQFWYFSAVLLLSYPTLSTAFPPTWVTETVPSFCREHHAVVTLDDHAFEALEPIELRMTDPGTLIIEGETPNSQKPNLHEAGRYDMKGIYEYFDGPIDFDCVPHLWHGGHPWTLASSSQPPGASLEQTQSTVIDSRPSPLSPMFTQGQNRVRKGGIEALTTHSSTLLEGPGQNDQPEKDANMPGSRKRSREYMANPVNVHASSSTEELSTDVMTFETPPIREITADQLDAIMKANSVHKVTDGQNGDFQILLSESHHALFGSLVYERLHPSRAKSNAGLEFQAQFVEHATNFLGNSHFTGGRPSSQECNPPRNLHLTLRMCCKDAGVFKNVWKVSIVKRTEGGRKPGLKTIQLAPRIAKVYEIMYFFHSLAFGYPRLTSYQEFDRASEQLREWFWNILFRGTDHSLPILGLVRLPQKPQNLQTLFGDLQIYLAKALAELNYRVSEEVIPTSLTLLRYWCKTERHKVGLQRFENDEGYLNMIYQAALTQKNITAKRKGIRRKTP